MASRPGEHRERGEQFFARCLLEQVARLRLLIKRYRYGPHPAVHGQHEELSIRQDSLKFLHCINAGHAGKVDIHENDMRFVCLQWSERSFGIGPYTDKLETQARPIESANILRTWGSSFTIETLIAIS